MCISLSTSLIFSTLLTWCCIQMKNVFSCAIAFPWFFSVSVTGKYVIDVLPMVLYLVVLIKLAASDGSLQVWAMDFITPTTKISTGLVWKLTWPAKNMSSLKVVLWHGVMKLITCNYVKTSGGVGFMCTLCISVCSILWPPSFMLYIYIVISFKINTEVVYSTCNLQCS